jgi:hypothetical protein
LLSGSTCLLLATCLSVHFLKSQVRACVSFLMVVWFDREQCLVSFNRYRYDKKYIWFYTGKFCFFLELARLAFETSCSFKKNEIRIALKSLTVTLLI